MYDLRGSREFQLVKADWLKVGKGALVAAAGAAFVWLSEYATSTELTPNQAILLTAVASIGANLVRKWALDTTKG